MASVLKKTPKIKKNRHTTRKFFYQPSPHLPPGRAVWPRSKIFWRQVLIKLFHSPVWIKTLKHTVEQVSVTKFKTDYHYCQKTEDNFLQRGNILRDINVECSLFNALNHEYIQEKRNLIFQFDSNREGACCYQKAWGYIIKQAELLLRQHAIKHVTHPNLIVNSL